MSCFKEIRKTWVPLIKIALSSGADIVGDWVFYDRILKDTDTAVEKYELPLLIFFIVSCIMGALTICTLLCKGFCPRHQLPSSSNSTPDDRRFKTLAFIARWTNLVLSMEIILEDIPQFVLTSLVSYDKGLLTPSAVFNITTSAFNFLFNVLDMITPDDDGDDVGIGVGVVVGDDVGVGVGVGVGDGDGDENGGDGQQMETADERTKLK